MSDGQLIHNIQDFLQIDIHSKSCKWLLTYFESVIVFSSFKTSTNENNSSKLVSLLEGLRKLIEIN